ncbi:MAG: dipeptidase PepV [Clostridiales bacterium]|nr:dipeptidase PepV [Clostridiales bacterium]
MNFNRELDALESELIASLQELIRIKSVGEDGGEHPFGDGPHACLEACLALGEKLGFRTASVDDMAGYVEYGSGEEMIAVLGHVDVVPEGDGWNYPPYGAVIDNGRMYGRGTVDDKGPTIAAFYALKAIKDAGVPLSRRIRIIFGLDEEKGSRCIKHYVAKGEELPVMGFTPDGEYPIIYAEKGIVNATFARKLSADAKRRIASFNAGIASNVVPEFAKAELSFEIESELPEKVTAEGKVLSAAGVNAHGSTPELGENAIGRLFIAMDKLGFDGDWGEAVKFIAENIGMQTRGESLGVARRDDVSGDLTLNMGLAKLEGDTLSVSVNIRYPVTIDFDGFFKVLVSKMAEGGFEEVSHTHKKALYMPPETELIRCLQKVYEEQTGEPARLISMGGGTYAKAMPNIVAFGPIFPGDEAVEHKPNEYVELDKLMKNAKIIAAAMYEMAK